MIGPIAGSSVTSARPWFRWAPHEVGDGVDGVRVQVCAARDCARVEADWEAGTARTQSPVDLAPGVHFWRVFARRGTALDAVATAPWSFVVPREPTRSRLPPALGDLDGDGVAETFSVRSSAPSARPHWQVEVRSGASPRLWLLRGAQSRYDPMTRLSIREDASSPIPIGDLNGDGYEDLLALAYTEHISGHTRTFFAPSLVRWYGGSGGPSLAGQSFASGRSGDGATASHLSGAYAIGDADGDGYGDVLVRDEYRGATTLRVYRGGRERSEATAFDCDCWQFPQALGDFDGDGRNEVILATGIGSRYFPPVVFGLGQPRTNLDRCAGVADFGVSTPSAASVWDDDLDGYDDLRFGSTAYFRGGPGGLSVERCGPPPAR
jgi:hypothetical protein